MAAVLRIKGANDKVYEIPAIQGPPGKDYVLTDADLTEIANKVLANFIDVSEVGQ